MSLSREITPHLPFLRRYARALTGSQSHGDAFVRATMETIISSQGDFPTDVEPRVGLYRVFHVLWSTAMVEDDAEPDPPDSSVDAIGRSRIAAIPPLSRQALLLTAMEGFADEDVGYILGIPADQVQRLVADALAEIERQTRADVLIIEDEPVVAMDLETIVRDLGHGISAVASTRDEAVAAAKAHRPGLVLADIRLADGSSGIDAVKDILAEMKVPVIFITAFPEDLLRPERPDPTFLITKPFQRSTVKAAIAQALFFDSATLPA